MGGFFPDAASALSDLAIVAEIAFAITLVVGMFVVRAGHVRAHMYLQSTVVLANLPVTLLWMLPRYLAEVLPGIPAELDSPFYYLPTIMLVVGTTALVLGVFILLVAGTNWIPERWRFRRYKRWMRTELVLWWTVLILGFSTYYVWYVGGGES